MTRCVCLAFVLAVVLADAVGSNVSALKIDGFDKSICGKSLVQTRRSGRRQSSKKDWPRIFAGYFAKAGEFPSALKYLGQKVNTVNIWENCGATLIHSDLAITAAHCVITSSRKIVYAGIVDFSAGYGPQGRREVTKSCVHRSYRHDYRGFGSPYDVAILKLDSPYTYSDYIQPACLDVSWKAQTAHMLTVVGFGSFGAYSNQKISDQLRAANMKPSCWNTITTTCLTFTNPHPGQGCTGDSGSGAFFKTKAGKSFVTGAVSFGNDVNCAGPIGKTTSITDFGKIPGLADLISSCM